MEISDEELEIIGIKESERKCFQEAYNAVLDCYWEDIIMGVRLPRKDAIKTDILRYYKEKKWDVPSFLKNTKK